MTENPKLKIRPAIKPTYPVFSHLEAEWVMEMILRSGHEHTEHLLAKFAEGAESPEVYERLLERVRSHVKLTQEP